MTLRLKMTLGIGIILVSLILAFALVALRSQAKYQQDLAQHQADLIAIGNGTASRETEELVATLIREGVPDSAITSVVGGNSLLANFVASFVGAIMYFATLTEVPIVKSFLDLGMGQGPALALLLAGPALSLPSMLVLRKIMGTQKMLVYVSIVVVMATISGYIFGLITQ